jgi:hypothetical protein
MRGVVGQRDGDLTGLEVELDYELPSDDTGYGFDTIGDVLTMAPLLVLPETSPPESATERMYSPSLLTRVPDEPVMAVVIFDPPPPGKASPSRATSDATPADDTKNDAVSVAVVTPGPLMVPETSTPPSAEMLLLEPRPLVPEAVFQT